jgi:hypothetical protein
MYPNIPTNELIPIIENMSYNNQLDMNTTQDIMKITSTILEQNYFTFRNINYSQITGLAMGAPSSAVLSEIYLRYLEHTRILNILAQHNLRGYFRYVDDILIIYDDDHTDIQEVHVKLNGLSPTIKFTLEKENEHCIDFLDITIHNKDNKLSFSIYRKPTATDIIIPIDSCHPLEHKYAAIRYMLERLHKYKLNDLERRTEQQIIEQIITNNGYETSIVKHLDKHRPKIDTTSKKSPWAKFTYFGKQTRNITKLFSDTQLQIAHNVNNTIGKILARKPRNQESRQLYQQSGIYSLTCPDCHMKYTGQTGRSFQKRFREHFHDYKYNIRKSNSATHLLDHKHSIGPIFEIMDILHTTKKGRFMDTIEKFHIYKQTLLQNQINDKNTVKPNAILDLVCTHDSLLTPTPPPHT